MRIIFLVFVCLFLCACITTNQNGWKCSKDGCGRYVKDENLPDGEYYEYISDNLFNSDIDLALTINPIRIPAKYQRCLDAGKPYSECIKPYTITE